MTHLESDSPQYQLVLSELKDGASMSTRRVPETVQYTDLFRQRICSSTAIIKYEKRISGALLDRIDLHMVVPRFSDEELLRPRAGEPSSAIRERVCHARAMQAERFATPLPPADPARSSVMPIWVPKRYARTCSPSKPLKALLRAAIQELGRVSFGCARAYHLLLKVARTIADLGDATDIVPTHVAAAIPCRSLDRKLWGA